MNQFKRKMATVTQRFLGSTSTSLSPPPDYFELGTHSAFLVYSVNFIFVSLRNIPKLAF